MLDIADVRELLKTACEEAGSQSAWGKAHSISKAEVSGVLTPYGPSPRQPGKLILGALGLRKIIRYERLADEWQKYQDALDQPGIK